MIVPLSGIAQDPCVVSDILGEEILIRDFDTVSLRLQVTDADDTDLAGFQSVGAVRLHFEHQQLSDLTITLTSPSGETIILVGPALPNGTDFSVFPIDHDVTFLPNPTIFMPDPPLQSPWNNLLGPAWSTRSAYTGTYAPHLGGLEIEFNIGSILGVWELTIIDHFLNGEGKLKRFEIEFIRTDGLACGVPCESFAGTFTQDTIFVCQGNMDFDFTSLYDLSPSPSPQYTDEIYVYDQTGSLVARGAPPDLSSLPSGLYTAHGFNIATDQSATLFGLQSLSRLQLVDSVRALGGMICMDMSAPVFLEVKQPVVERRVEDLCLGDTIDFFGQRIFESGMVFQEGLRCDTLYILDVTASDLSVQLGRDTVYVGCDGMEIFGPNVT